MNSVKQQRLVFSLMGTLLTTIAVAQFQGRGPGFRFEETGPMVRTEGGQLVNQDTVRTARETAPQVADTPN